MVAQYVMPRSRQFAELGVDPAQEGFFRFQRVGAVDEIAQFDHQVRLGLGEFLAGRRQLDETVAIVPIASRRPIGVMHVGQQADPQQGRLRLRIGGRRRAGCQAAQSQARRETARLAQETSAICRCDR